MNIQNLVEGSEIVVFVHPNVGRKVNSLHDFSDSDRPECIVPDREGPRLCLWVSSQESLGPLPAVCLKTDSLWILSSSGQQNGI